MSLARIEIEEHRPGHWVGEVEAGYPACRRERVVGGDIVEVVTRVGEAYERLMGRSVFAPVSGAVVAERSVWEDRAAVYLATSEEVAEIEAKSVRVLPVGEFTPEKVVAEAKARGWNHERAPRDLVQQARSIGIPAKGTWTKARVLREVARVAGVAPEVAG